MYSMSYNSPELNIVHTIYILFNYFFSLQVMCMQYWPPSLEKKEVYGDIYISIDKEEQLANFHIRTFRIWKQNADVCKIISNHNLCIQLIFYLFKYLFQCT